MDAYVSKKINKDGRYIDKKELRIKM